MRAIARALPLLRPAHSLRIVRLPTGLDPDDLIKREGVQALERLLAEPRSLLDMLWEHERDALPLATPEAKAGLKARLMDHVETIADPDIKALYRRELTDRFSAFAFPRRESNWQPGKPGKPGKSGKSPPGRPDYSAPSGPRQQTTAPGMRAMLTRAVIAGLVRHQSQIGPHSEALARIAGTDPRIDVLLDVADAGPALESEKLATILAAKGLIAPSPDDFARIRYPFVVDGTDPAVAAEALEAAIVILVEEPALDAAIEAATARLDFDEQQRLLKRKLEFNTRLRQMAGARAASPSGDAPNTMAE
jgi:DNA primase